jgi:hypothetical protein
MPTEETLNNALEQHYAHIGYLFYSVAASDGEVRPAETQRLKQVIAEQWVPIERHRDELGTDDAYYIEFSFDLACDQRMSAEEAFGLFKKYYEGAHERFVRSERQLIMDTAKAIAVEVGRMNKSELVSLSRIAWLLERDGSPEKAKTS